MKVVYWNTSCLEPKIEAVSKEVFGLSRVFARSWIFAINRHLGCSFSLRKRLVGLNPRFHVFARLLIPILERQFDISHVYGDASPWPFSSAVGRRPTILTIAVESGEADVSFLKRCSKVIVQTPAARENLLRHGIEVEKIELMFPPVDLSEFRQFETRPLSPCPKILFATSPRTREEMEGRGVQLILDAAARGIPARWKLLFRKWRSENTAYTETLGLIENQRLKNVELELRNVSEMAPEYRDVDFTVIPFTRPDAGKPCPNSMIEGLACGLPTLISAESPMAGFVKEHNCGAVFDTTGESVGVALAWACENYAALSANAIDVARAHFSADAHYRRTRQIYQHVMDCRS